MRRIVRFVLFKVAEKSVELPLIFTEGNYNIDIVIVLYTRKGITV